MRSRKWLVPEVVQTSTIDCGPACLSALLGGFGIFVSYGRLREACQTGIDGTSIDTMEELANRLGLVAEQIVLPADHLVLPQGAALPAITVVKLASGLTHFVVVWRRHGRKLQIMDPAAGRQRASIQDFTQRLYIHEMAVPAEAWREWAQSPEFRGALEARLHALNARPQEASHLLAEALAQPGWRPIATLDGATRMAGSLVRAGALASGPPALRLLRTTMARALASPEHAADSIPRPYWSVWSSETDGELVARGAVVVRVKGRAPAAIDTSGLPPEIAAAVTETAPRPGCALWQLLKENGLLAPAVMAMALVAATIGVVIQALLFRALMEGGRELAARGVRLGAVTAVLLFLTALVAVEIPAAATLIALGRRLETRFRAVFLQKLPRIAEQYFHSRLISDMAERSHNLHYLRRLPNLAGQFLRSGFELILTGAGIVGIDHRLWPLALVSVLAAVALPAALQPALSERALRVRTHAGALSRFYLDALLGLVPIRTHVADNMVRAEHRSLLAKWASSALASERAGIVLEGVQMGVGFLLAALLTISHLSRYPESAAVLLVAYWSLNLPTIGRDLVALACEYPMYRNIALRLMEPLSAIEQEALEGNAAPYSTTAPSAHGPAAIALEHVSVVAGGHAVVHDLTLDIPAGSHLAIVGASGAGKSTLAALLLGWRPPSSGSLTVDGHPLSTSALIELRRTSAWVDPTVRLWNRSLLDNLRYGLEGSPRLTLGEAVEQAGFSSALEKLPQGFETILGDGGAVLSEGEGQRVRLARALLRPGVRLAVLDEPFRGLDADMREKLLDTARAHWHDATLVFATHDVSATLAFDRVLVMEGGRVIEDGSPAHLAKLPDSHYAALLREEKEWKRDLLLGSQWRRLQLERGAIREHYEPLEASHRAGEAVAL
jgi:ABC-type bacteriocin/lantibiotic exporter with double-glycine peptidase domain